jgi:hypothetical protein
MAQAAISNLRMKLSPAPSAHSLATPLWLALAPSLYSLNALHVLKGTDVAYIEIPKNATTVVKMAIWRLQHFFDATRPATPPSGSYHSDKNAPWIRVTRQPLRIISKLTLGRTRAFSVIRNPETRLLSAWLDKIVDVNRQPTRHKHELRRRLGFGDTVPDFEGFLERLQDKSLLYCDKHFVPQSDLVSWFGRRATCFSIEEPDLVRQIVAFIAADKDLQGFDHTALDRIVAPHPTHASTREVSQSHTSPGSRKLIETIYGQDYELFESINGSTPQR